MVRISGLIIMIISTIFMLIGPSYADKTKKPIKLAILPCTNIVMTFKKFYPLATYLTEETGLDIQLVVLKDFAEFESSIKRGDIDFALQDPHTYIKLVDLFNKGSLIRALNLEGGTFQSGVVIARKDSLINKVSDLKGKTVMFGPQFSASKWLAAKLLFEDNGVDIEKDLKGYSNGGCCEDIAFSVYLKAVDAGVVCDHFLADHEEKQMELGVEAIKITVVGRTKAVPTRVFGARKLINQAIITRINQALLKLDKKNPQHAKILYRAELGGFQKSRDEDYDAIRKLIAARGIE